jgi:hypothetical protein
VKLDKKKNETKGGKLTLLDRGWSTPIGWVAEFRGGLLELIK